jgi:hypothetical protein
MNPDQSFPDTILNIRRCLASAVCCDKENPMSPLADEDAARLAREHEVYLYALPSLIVVQSLATYVWRINPKWWQGITQAVLRS